ncbi:MAG: M24 family metallopeptidase [Ignavibacteriales bacterium]
MARFRLVGCLERDGLEGVIATTPENVYYITGFFGLPEWSVRLTQAYAVWVPEGLPALIVPLSELDFAAENVAEDIEVFCYGSFSYGIDGGSSAAGKRLASWLGNPVFPDPVAALHHVLGSRHLTGRAIGLDEVGLAPGLWTQIARDEPLVSPAYELLRRVRAVKSEQEIQALERVARITERAALKAVEATIAGESEMDLARRFHSHLVANDVWPEVTVVGAGSRSAFPNAQATGRLLAPGDIVRLDLCGYAGFYHSDIARTVIVGRPTPEYESVYSALLAGQQAAIESIHPGVRASDVFAVAVETARKEGLTNYERHHCGHGIGLEGYDAPLIGPGDTTVLEEGMALCIELPLYRVEWGGMQVEDTVVVTSTGARLLTSSPRGLWSMEGIRE